MPFGFAGAGAGGGVGLNPAGNEPLVDPLGCGGGGGAVLASCCCCILARYSFSYASSCSFLDTLFPLDVSAGFVPAGSVPFGFGAGGGGAVCVCAEPDAVDWIPYPAKYFVLGWYASFSLVAKYLFEGAV